MLAKIAAILFVMFSVSRGDFTNTEVTETIYADSHIIRFDAEITLDPPNAVSGPYHYLVDSELYDHLSLIEAKVIFKFYIIFRIPRPKLKRHW